MYLVLYRKYRPKVLKEVIGQDVVCNILKKSLQTNKIAHAYLFTGPRGIGKTSIAKIFSKAINCLKKDKEDACLECDICKLIDNEETTDIIEIDGASNNGVDEIRDLKEKVRFSPSVCKNKVYIIDEVHMLTNSAFNALLKTLEEPPKNVVFILCTTEPHKIPETILSRLIRFDFSPISINDIYDRLFDISKKENIKIDQQALYKISELSNGGLRDALSLLDKVSAFSNSITLSDVNKVSGVVDEDVLIDIIYNINLKKYFETFEILDNLYKNGKDISLIINGLIKVLKDILIDIKLHKNNEKLKRLNLVKEDEVFEYFNILRDLNTNIRYTSDKKTSLDLSIIKMLDITKNKDYLLESKIQQEVKKPLVTELNTSISNDVVSETRDFDFKNLEFNLFPNNNKKDTTLDKINNENFEISDSYNIDDNNDFLEMDYELLDEKKEVNTIFKETKEKIVFSDFLEIEYMLNNFLPKNERIEYFKRFKGLYSILSLEFQNLLLNFDLKVIQKDFKKIIIVLDTKEKCIFNYQNKYFELMNEIRESIFPYLEKIIYIDKESFDIIQNDFISKYQKSVVADKKEYITLDYFDLKLEEKLNFKSDRLEKTLSDFETLKNLIESKKGE